MSRSPHLLNNVSMKYNNKKYRFYVLLLFKIFHAFLGGVSPRLRTVALHNISISNTIKYLRLNFDKHLIWNSIKKLVLNVRLHFDLSR